MLHMVYSSRLLFLCLYVQFMGDFVNAIRDYQAAVKTDPSYALAYYNAANIYFRQRQFQQVSFIVVNIHFLLLGALDMEEEDPSTRKILEGGSTLRWVYMQKFWSVWYPNVECLRRN